jgi:XapX domain-containing protein
MTSEIWLALAVGVIVGAIFGAIKLPIPAPTNIAGILGIVGIFVGYWLVNLR